MNNIQKSWKGQPTTNLVNDTMSIYNNVPSHVTAALSTTGEYYNGANIYQLTLTPTTSTGVSYLTGANNPGLGVVSNSGGGQASRYTGHSIFFKPTVPMASSPIYTHYSNIGGWQSSANYYSMGDGWYRAHVIWYDTTTRSDGKYWAINPASATLNVPIITYFAGPFKEDRNDSAYVSQYTVSSRSTTNSIIDLTGRNTVTVGALVYNTDGTYVFNGSEYVDLGVNSYALGITRNATYSAWIKPTSNSACYGISDYGTNGLGMTLRTNSNASADFYVYPNNHRITYTYAFNANTWYNLVGVMDGANMYMYLNGVQVGSNTLAEDIGNSANTLKIGSRGEGGTAGAAYGIGYVSHVMVHNRALTSAEIFQNFQALRGRYGL
jgi:hypothetical protein